jgi:hypothetical protein
MKQRFYNENFYKQLFLSFFTLSFLFFGYSASGQQNCQVAKEHGQGYTTSIINVTDNGNNSHTIVLNVKHNGCTDTCKSMARYSVEAQPGTYSNVFVTLISGNINYQNIDLGPNLGGDPFTGFRITGTAGFGNGLPGEFNITYTLTGGFQNQQTQVKAGGDFLLVSFSAADFEYVLGCDEQNQSIFPYYTPPEGGKLVSIIGPELTSLYNYYSAGGTPQTDDIFQIFGSDVLVEVKVKDGMYASLLNLLSASYGFYDVVEDADMLIITGKIPILNLLSLK